MESRGWDSRPHYERLIGPIRERARELGYAIAVHGSLKRDIDLIACPWAEGAAPARELAEALRVVCDGYYSWSMKGSEFTLNGCPGNKPHGRLGWVISLEMNHGGGPCIDLSVMPLSPRQVAIEPEADSETRFTRDEAGNVRRAEKSDD